LRLKVQKHAVRKVVFESRGSDAWFCDDVKI
jgi:hypothetical protein